MPYTDYTNDHSAPSSIVLQFDCKCYKPMLTGYAIQSCISAIQVANDCMATSNIFECAPNR